MARLHDIWEVPERQVSAFTAALAVGDFPWAKLRDGILRDVGRDYIPAQLSDLSRWHGSGTEHGTHVHGPNEPHVLEARERVLGLFWLDFRIEVETTLQSNPRLLAEVLWSEGAHAIDYAMMTDPQRDEIMAALHPNGPDTHPWWEVHDYAAEYDTLGGEAMMALVYEAFTGRQASIELHHPPTPAAIETVRRILTPVSQPPPVIPTDLPYFGLHKSKVVHDTHDRIAREVEWPTLAAAVADGRRPCRVCKPSEAA